MDESHLLTLLAERNVAAAAKLLKDPSTPPEVLNKTDAWGKNALHLAALEKMPAVCNLLLHRPDFAGVDASDMYNMSTMHYAAESGLGDICEAILARSDFTSVNDIGVQGWSVLHLAAKRGLTSTCRLLLARRSGLRDEVVDAADTYAGMTALHWAAMNGWVAVCHVLLSRDSRFSAINAKEKEGGMTALHLAAVKGLGPVARLLLDRPDFTAADAQDNDGETALHWAAWKGHLDVCELLLQHPGFDAPGVLNAIDNDGMTALRLALKSNNREVPVEILLRNTFIFLRDRTRCIAHAQLATARIIILALVLWQCVMAGAASCARAAPRRAPA